MQVALVHDWLTGMRGGEKCLEVFCELFPEADLFTLVHVPGSVSPTIERHRIHTSLLQRLPGSARHYRWYLPLMPTAIETFDLSAYDGVLAFGATLADVYDRRGWGNRVYVWHEAADIRRFHPPEHEGARQGLIWIGNWGDGERSAEITEYLLAPARDADAAGRHQLVSLG